MKKTITSVILFLTALTAIYILWAMQPPVVDDWGLSRVKFFIPPGGPQWRNMIMEVILVNPLSWFKPGILITDIFLVSMAWVVLKNEAQTTRFIITLLLAVGFPYLGTVSTWCVASGAYGLSAAQFVLWFLFYLAFKDHDRFIISIVLFVLTFFTSISHEVWLLSFPMVILYVVLEGVRTKRKRDIFNALSISLGYIVALAYYTNKGPQQFIDVRTSTPGLFHSLFTPKHLLTTLLHGTKENLVLLKDCIPVFLLIAYIKGRNSFKNLESRIFVFLFIGILLYIYANYFLIGAPFWRCRWLCACGLTLVFLSAPLNSKKNLRYVCLALSCAWLLYNGFFTYYHTSIDVKGWLQYRHRVLCHDPKVLKEHPYWGKQDDKYRFFWPPPTWMIKQRVLEYWQGVWYEIPV